MSTDHSLSIKVIECHVSYLSMLNVTKQVAHHQINDDFFYLMMVIKSQREKSIEEERNRENKKKKKKKFNKIEKRK